MNGPRRLFRLCLTFKTVPRTNVAHHRHQLHPTVAHPRAEDVRDLEIKVSSSVSYLSRLHMNRQHNSGVAQARHQCNTVAFPTMAAANIAQPA